MFSHVHRITGAEQQSSTDSPQNVRTKICRSRSGAALRARGFQIRSRHARPPSDCDICACLNLPQPGGGSTITVLYSLKCSRLPFGRHLPALALRKLLEVYSIAFTSLCKDFGLHRLMFRVRSILARACQAALNVRATFRTFGWLDPASQPVLYRITVCVMLGHATEGLHVHLHRQRCFA